MSPSRPASVLPKDLDATLKDPDGALRPETFMHGRGLEKHGENLRCHSFYPFMILEIRFNR